jgi:hypothetical protein
MDFLNGFFRRENGSYRLKMDLLVPIGLPDEASQEAYLRSRGVHSHPISANIRRDVAFHYNRHRFSHSELDAKLVTFLKSLYEQHGFVDTSHLVFGQVNTMSSSAMKYVCSVYQRVDALRIVV